MKILSLSTKNFRNLENNRKYEFREYGITCVFGMNEAGKTSLMESIEEVFFGKVEKNKVPVFKAWEKKNRPVITLQIKDNSDNLIDIERNYEEWKSYLNGKAISLKSEKAIKAYIHDLFGFSDVETFRILLRVKQRGISNLTGPKIQQELEHMITGKSRGLTVYDILNTVGQKLTKDRGAFKGQDGKTYNYIVDALDSLYIQEKTIKNDLGMYEKKRLRLFELKKLSENTKKEIDHDSKNIDWLKLYIEDRTIFHTIKSISKLTAKIELLNDELKSSQSYLQAQEEKLVSYKILKELKTKLTLMKTETAGLEKTHEKLLGINENIATLSKQLEGRLIPKLSDIDKYKTLTSNCKELSASQSVYALNIEIAAKKKLHLNIQESQTEIEPNARKTFKLVGYENVFSIDDVFDAVIFNESLSETNKKIKFFNHEIQKIERGFSVKSLDELEKIFTLNQELMKLRQEQKLLLEGKKDDEFFDILSEKRAHIQKCQDEIDSLSEKLTNQKDLEVEEALYARKKEEFIAQDKRRSNFIAKKDILLGGKTETHIENEKYIIEEKLSKIEVDEEFKNYYMQLSSSSDDTARNLEKLKEKATTIIMDLSNKKDTLYHTEIELAVLNTELSKTHTYEEFSRLEEKIEELEKNREKSKKFLNTLRELEDALYEAKNQTLSTINKAVDLDVSRLFSTLTFNKYDSVKTTPEGNLLVKKGTAKDYIDLSHDGRSLSTGTYEQLYFALRATLIGILTKGRTLPLLLDDPFADYDSKRLKEACGLIEKLSHTGLQCILFTCHENVVNSLNDATIVEL